MLGFLLLVTVLWAAIFILLFDFFYEKQQNPSLRENFLVSSLVLAALVLVFTEGLSLFTALTPTALKIAWGLAFFAVIGWVWSLFKRQRESLSVLRNEIASTWASIKSQGWQPLLLLVLVVVQMTILLVIIYEYPTPNNGDSMRYHMTRVVQWEQQASVDHFAVHKRHQISFPPFAEYAILNIAFLTGGDHLSRIVQLFAMLVCLVGVTEIAQALGADFKKQTMAAMVCAALPTAILQATTTQNDLVAAAWLVCFTAFGLKFSGSPDKFLWAAAAGLSLGFGLLTKSTVFIFALPMSVWIGAKALIKGGFRPPVWKAGLTMVALALLVNLAHFTRNTITFSNPLGDNANTVNTIHSFPAFASNTIRIIQMNMLPVERGAAALDFLGEQALRLSSKLHDLTGMDPQDRRTTYGFYQGFENPAGLSTNETVGGSFLQVVLVFGTLLAALFSRKRGIKSQLVFLLSITFLLFAFLVKVQTPINRLLVPLMVVWSPLIADLLFPTKQKWWVVLPVMLWLLSLPWVLDNHLRPLVAGEGNVRASWPREGVEAYFIRDPDLFPIYQEITDTIMQAGCQEVGIKINTFFEYPFWIMLYEKGFDGTIKHVLVQNESRIYEDAHFSPCVIFTDKALDLGSDYVRTIFGDYSIYAKE